MHHRFGGRVFGRVWIVLALALAASLNLPAQQAASTGVIEGQVKDSVVGESLNNARVAVKGTTVSVFTDASGHYRLAGVPAGQVTLRAFFTGLAPAEAEVTVAAGQVARQDFALSKPKAAGAPETIKLDEFVVQSTRETNAQEIAINEQRVSPNMKSVVATDAYGPMANHNVGEFLKWLPGVGVDYFANNITGVNVNGLGSINTEVQFDGMRNATSFTESNDRGFQMKASSVADIQRVEIRKMPLPEDSANSIGGTINLIGRSAFEYDKPRLDYQVYMSSDGERLTWNKRDGPKDREMQYWRPNFAITYTDPITKNFGVSIAISHDDKIVRTHWSQPGWNYGTTAANTGPDIAEPTEAQALAGTGTFTPRFNHPANTGQLLHDAPIKDATDEIGIRADWRPIEDLTLSGDVRYVNYYNQTSDDVRYSWSTGNAIYADEHTTDGTPGAGNARFNTPLWRDQYEPSLTESFTGTWKHDVWTAYLLTGYSVAKHSFADTKDGFFNSTDNTGNDLSGKALFAETGIGTGTAHPVPLTVNFKNQSGAMPQTIQAFDASGNPVDWSSANNIWIGGVRSKPSKDHTIDTPLRVSLQRDFSLWGNPAYVKIGYDWLDEYRNRQRYDQLNWAFVGPDHIAQTADDSAAQIAAIAIGPHRDNIYNAPPIQHISLSRLYAIYQAHPDYFQFKDVESYRQSTIQPTDYDERTLAPYIQGSLQLFHNRLSLVGGVRFEKTSASGHGYLQNPNAAFQKYSDGITPKNTADILNTDGTPQRYSDGTVKRTGDTLGSNGLPTKRATGTFVYLPGVTAGSMQEAQLVSVRKGAYGSGSNQGYFPSLHATFHITDNLQWRGAFAKTQAKVRFDRSVIPSTSISDTPSTASNVPVDNLGTISVRNPNLKPWIGYNYQTDLEYYTNSGGLFEGGIYRRSIHNFQENTNVYLDSAATAAQYNLGPEWVGYVASSWVNTTSVKIDGVEASVAQSLDPFTPVWASGFTFKANYNYNNLKGNVTLTNGDFGSLYDDREAAFLSYQRRRVGVNVGFIRTGYIFQQLEPANGGIPGVRKYVPMDQWDASLSIVLTKNVDLYLAANDITAEQKTRDRFISGAPAYSRLQIENTLGRTYSIGITGSF